MRVGELTKIKKAWITSVAEVIECSKDDKRTGGTVKIFDKDYKYFTTGKSTLFFIQITQTI